MVVEIQGVVEQSLLDFGSLGKNEITNGQICHARGKWPVGFYTLILTEQLSEKTSNSCVKLLTTNCRNANHSRRQFCK